MFAGIAKAVKTLLYVGEAILNGKYVHFTVYQNTVEDRTPTGVGNAMILAVPAKNGFGAGNLIDTTEFPHVLKDMEKAVAPVAKSLSCDGDRVLGLGPSIQIAECGIYTCLIAAPHATAAEIRHAIEHSIASDKRPLLTDTYVAGLQAAYKRECYLMFACFANKDESEAHPIAYWYEPTDPSRLHYPTLDNHRGEVPVAGEPVEFDHWLLVGSHLAPQGNEVQYTDVIPADVRPLFPNFVGGSRVKGWFKNGDFSADVAEVRHGAFNSVTHRWVSPPGLT